MDITLSYLAHLLLILCVRVRLCSYDLHVMHYDLKYRFFLINYFHLSTRETVNLTDDNYKLDSNKIFQFKYYNTSFVPHQTNTFH